MTRAGTALVEVESSRPEHWPRPRKAWRRNLRPRLQAPVLFLQAGAFGVAANANQLAERLRREGIESVRVLEPDAGSNLFRVRVGPLPA